MRQTRSIVLKPGGAAAVAVECADPVASQGWVDLVGRMEVRTPEQIAAAFREAGVPPERLLGLLAHWCGWAAEGESVSLRALLGRFDLARLPRSPVVVPSDRWLVDSLVR